MNTIALQYQKLEANLDQLHARIPDLPQSSILLSRLILHLGRGMSNMLEHEIRPAGLTEAEFRVLTTLFSQPEAVVNPGDLCTKTSQSPANMSRICDALVGRGLITRASSQSDRRKLVLRITEVGEKLVHELLPKLFGPLRDLFQGFSVAQQEALVAEFKQLGARLDEIMAQRYGDRLHEQALHDE